jgi:Bacterial protein of unknown function (DUF882)
MRNRSKILTLLWGATLATALGGAAMASPKAAKPAAASATLHAAMRHAVRPLPRRAHKHSAGVTMKSARRVGGDTAVRKPKSNARAVRPHPQGVTIQAGRRVVRSPEPPSRPAPPCLRPPVTVERGFGGDVEQVALTRCDGLPAPQAAERLSVLARPGAFGFKLLDLGLVTRIQNVVDHFHAGRVTIVSGYRPNSAGSFHQRAQALDFALSGVKNEELVAFCRTLPDTGCGYYPNSSFVHVDVRPPHTGHVYWIDTAGPGEPPRYVSTWPVEVHPELAEARPVLTAWPVRAEDPFAP